MRVQVTLRAIAPSENRFREYQLETRPSDGGGFELLTRRGRIGKPLRDRIDHFATEEELAEEVGRLLRLRTLHGYVVAR